MIPLSIAAGGDCQSRCPETFCNQPLGYKNATLNHSYRNAWNFNRLLAAPLEEEALSSQPSHYSDIELMVQDRHFSN